ncbi:MAG: proline dehydrogenase family protein [Bacteroidia bacterium]|nr:proline dehydrogenase family protein [Bacteroidia bacterium]
MERIDFQDTATAFSHLTDKDLVRSKQLFSLFGQKWLLTVGKPLLNFSLVAGLPVKGIIRATIFKQFCGGEFIEDCMETIQRLGKRNVKSILDYSVEGKETEDDFRRNAEEIIATVKKAKGNPNIPFCVFKVTGVARFSLLEEANSGEKLRDVAKAELEMVKHRIENICHAAFEAGVPILIDAEETWIQNTIDYLAEEMMVLFNKEKHIVFNTVQLYRHSRLEYMQGLYERSLEKGFKPGLKLVRGAYMEKERERAQKMGYPSPINANKQQTDQEFNQALDFCLKHHPHFAICAGTHNEESSLHLVNLMHHYGLSANDKHVWFSQLLGMSDNISYNLASAGYNVTKYVPYGPVEEVMPYLMRRAEENTSIEGQTGRELKLIEKELDRRKGK